MKSQWKVSRWATGAVAVMRKGVHGERHHGRHSVRCGNGLNLEVMEKSQDTVGVSLVWATER